METAKFEEAEYCLQRIKSLKRLKELLDLIFKKKEINIKFEVQVFTRKCMETLIDPLQSLMPKYIDGLNHDDFDEILKSIDRLIENEELKFKKL